MSQTLGKVIRTRRIEMGWTQEDLAKRVKGGMRQAEVSRLEIGRVSLPRHDRLQSIAQALGLPVGELLERAGWSGADDAFATAGEPTMATQQEYPAPVREQASPRSTSRQPLGN